MVSHFEAALYFSRGDHAEINCQTSLTPPCHLIIACNTRECWQCWAIDSWHSLKHLIIFSHKPLSTCQLLCIVYEKSCILRFQDYAPGVKLAHMHIDCLKKSFINDREESKSLLDTMDYSNESGEQNLAHCAGNGKQIGINWKASWSFCINLIQYLNHYMTDA